MMGGVGPAGASLPGMVGLGLQGTAASVAKTGLAVGEKKAQVESFNSIKSADEKAGETLEVQEEAAEKSIVQAADAHVDAVKTVTANEKTKKAVEKLEDAFPDLMGEAFREQALIEKEAQGLQLSKEEKQAFRAGPGSEEFQAVAKKVMGVEDFIYRGGARGGTITPINQADQLLGAKPGGPIAGALGAGNTVYININGGDTAKIYETVKRAMKASGVR